MNRRIRVLQTRALPLGYVAVSTRNIISFIKPVVKKIFAHFDFGINGTDYERLNIIRAPVRKYA